MTKVTIEHVPPPVVKKRIKDFDSYEIFSSEGKIGMKLPTGVVIWFNSPYKGFGHDYTESVAHRNAELVPPGTKIILEA
jgi:hypothetical protein